MPKAPLKCKITVLKYDSAVENAYKFYRVFEFSDGRAWTNWGRIVGPVPMLEGQAKNVTAAQALAKISEKTGEGYAYTEQIGWFTVAGIDSAWTADGATCRRLYGMGLRQGPVHPMAAYTGRVREPTPEPEVSKDEADEAWETLKATLEGIARKERT